MTTTNIIRKTAPFVWRYRWLVAITLVFTLIGSSAAQVNAIILNYAVDTIADLIQAGKRLSDGINMLIFISVILLVKEVIVVGTSFGQRYCGEKLKINISQDLSRSVIERILTYRLAFFTTAGNEPGRIQSRIDRGVDAMGRLVQNIFIDIIPLILSAIIALTLIFIQNFWIGLTALLIIPIYFYVSFLQARRLKGRRREMMSFREQKSQGIINILESIGVIKSFNREKIEGEKQLKLLTDIRMNMIQTRKTSFAYDSIKTFVEQIGVVLMIILSAYFVLEGKMQLGAIMYNIMLFANVTAPIRQMHRIYDDMSEAVIYAGGYFSIMDAAPTETEPSGTYRPEKIKGNIEMRDVDFTYPNGVKALHDVSLNISQGKVTALVGLSGAGKSTIINLLDKFYMPDRGSILLDGVDLRDWDTTYLRENIGLVLQKNHIFEGSIEDNILYGNPNATHEQVIEAAKKAFLYDQIMALPEGFKTNATNLSGGQQQRVAIARMFIKDPAIIFLDEPTASLDAIATEQIKNSLDAIKKGRTVIMISHSLSQIIDADEIYSLENGRVMEHGTHEECYSNNGVYRSIFDASARSLNIDKIAKTMASENNDNN